MVGSEDREAVLHLEERFWLEGGGNPDFWRRYFAEEGLVALPFGIMGKPRTVEAMEQSHRWVRVEMQDLHVVPVAAASLLVTYRAVADRAEERDAYVAIVSSLYVRRGHGWELLFHQQSPVEGPAG